VPQEKKGVQAKFCGGKRKIKNNWGKMVTAHGANGKSGEKRIISGPKKTKGVRFVKNKKKKMRND